MAPFGRLALLSLLLCTLPVFGCAPESDARSARAGNDAASPERSAPPQPGFALVELFTSEGCSSCPPADEVAAAIAVRDQPNVHVVVFHVDYWDSLGWKDPFGRPEHAARQRRYAAHQGAARVYTPQMVVNGVAAFVGSDQARADAEIDKATTSPAIASIELSLDPTPLANLRHALFYEIHPHDHATWPVEAELCAAVVESALQSRVTRGENAGRTLNHARCVRWFQSIALNADRAGRVLIHAPADLNPANTEIVAWVQDPESMRIVAAGALPLEPGAH